MEKMGIEQTERLVKFAIDMCFAGIYSYEDGRFAFEDLKHFITLLDDAYQVFTSVESVPREIEDMSALEMDRLTSLILRELDDKMRKEEALFVAKKLLTAIKAGYDAFLAVRGLHADA